LPQSNLGDPLYGADKMAESKGHQRLALRAVKLVYRDPFQKRKIWIEALTEEFLKEFTLPSQA
jgi:23S rRNA-/tRNA-specific pseudouridylate synthase